MSRTDAALIGLLALILTAPAFSAHTPPPSGLESGTNAPSESQGNPASASDKIIIPPGKEDLPAEQVFKNIEILRGKPASRLPGMMRTLNGLLGVGCTHCHVEGAWEKEEPPEKITARHMFHMIGEVNKTYFPDAQPGITCWTCHHGGPKPSMGNEEIGAAMQKLSPERKKLIAELTEKLGDKKDQPVEQVFANIQFFKGMPAARLLSVMNVFTIVLGVDCTHCHVEGAWEKDDKKPKQVTRTMLRMVPDINQQLFGSEFKVACWTCHRGVAEPENLPK